MKTSSFFIHYTPPLIAWIVRWRNVAFSFRSASTWAPFTHNGSFFAGISARRFPTILSLLLPPLIAYALWFVPYGIWLISHGSSLPFREIPLSSSFGDFSKNLPRSLSLRSKALLYLLFHACAVSVSFLFAAFLYSHFLLHSAYLLFLLAASIRNGAEYYSYTYGGPRSARLLRELSESSRPVKAD